MYQLFIIILMCFIENQNIQVNGLDFFGIYVNCFIFFLFLIELYFKYLEICVRRVFLFIGVNGIFYLFLSIFLDILSIIKLIEMQVIIKFQFRGYFFNEIFNLFVILVIIFLVDENIYKIVILFIKGFVGIFFFRVD